MSLDFKPSFQPAAKLSAARSQAAKPAPLQNAAPRDILSSIGETVYDWNIVSDEIAWGPNVADVLPVGDRASLATGRAYAGLVTWDSALSRREAILRATETDEGNGALYHLEYDLLLDPDSRNSRLVRIEDTGRCFAGPDGKPVRAHGAVRVLPPAAASRSTHGDAIRFDALTGALTRNELTACINRLFSEARPGQQGFALLLLAVDDLAAFNRKHGYEAGDALIAAAAKRLRERMRANDILARYTGNRFALLLQNCDSEQLAAAATRFLDAPKAGIETAQGSFKAQLRAGGVCAPQHARSTQQLYQHAEEAIDAARQQTGRFAAYAPSIAANHERLRNQAIGEHILEALNQRQISIALQPIVSARSGKPVFYEALLRIRTSEGRTVSPASIIPVAEKTGLITLLDQRVLELVLDQLAADPSLTLSVNISGITAQDPAWLDALRSRLSLQPGLASRLIVEITETCAIGDIDVMRERISLMRETGLRIAMDDFGAGYSSFRNLRGLGIDLLKIDGAFVQNLARSPDDRFFVRTLIELAGHLQIPVVAEWVENLETATLLADWGVDYCQGAWFGMGRELGHETLAPSTHASESAAA